MLFTYHEPLSGILPAESHMFKNYDEPDDDEEEEEENEDENNEDEDEDEDEDELQVSTEPATEAPQQCSVS